MVEESEDMGEMWREHKKFLKEKRVKNLEKANPEGWTIHTEFHWSRTLNGKRLDYWPSRDKFQYEGKVRTGGVEGFIKRRDKSTKGN